jgi:lipopolysaccharide transport system permease protein
MIPPAYRPYVYLNPLSALFDAYHAIFVGHQQPDWLALWPLVLLAVVCSALAAHVVHQRGAEMVDEL